MRELLSDPCHILPESLVIPNHVPPRAPSKSFQHVQLKQEALKDLTSLVSESAFKCAPRFPGHTPSLINVSDKKSFISTPDLHPGYFIPKVGFCFDFSDHVMDSSRTRVGLRRIVEPGKTHVHWSSDEEETLDVKEQLIELSKVRVVILYKKGDDDASLSSWCVVKTAFTTNEPEPEQFVKFKGDDSVNEFVIDTDTATKNDFLMKDVVYADEVKVRLLDQCHEYTILQGLASRLATSFDKLFRTSGKFQILKKLEKDFKAIEEKDDAKGQSVKPADLDGEKKARDLKASWEEQKGTHDRIKDGKIKF